MKVTRPCYALFQYHILNGMPDVDRFKNNHICKLSRTPCSNSVDMRGSQFPWVFARRDTRSGFHWYYYSPAFLIRQLFIYKPFDKSIPRLWFYLERCPYNLRVSYRISLRVLLLLKSFCKTILHCLQFDIVSTQIFSFVYVPGKLLRCPYIFLPRWNELSEKVSRKVWYSHLVSFQLEGSPWLVSTGPWYCLHSG